jgi:hypothetical protein
MTVKPTTIDEYLARVSGTKGVAYRFRNGWIGGDCHLPSDAATIANQPARLANSTDFRKNALF